MLTFNVVWRPFRLVYVAVLAVAVAAVVFWLPEYLWLAPLICLAAYFDLDLEDLFKK